MHLPTLALLGSLVLPASHLLAAERPKPNILLILADDMGFSDAGCYGGEIETPNLDRLASGGLRFTQFYNTARCWPSRASLLTGYYAQAIRRDGFPGTPGNGQGTRPAWAPLLPHYLQPLGYRAYHSGKWHVDGLRLAGGFDRSYSLEDHNRYFAPTLHFEDDVKLPPVAPESGYYATTFIADHAIKCLRDHAANHAGKPFFSYLAFISPHFPLHAPAEDVAKYRGRYREGWDVMRQRRHERMKAGGLVKTELSPRTPEVPAWETVSAAEKDAWDARMSIHAAMVDRMDREIGRVLEQVRAMGAAEETIVFFMSDNGASAECLVRGDGHDPAAPAGSAATFHCLEPAGANVANAPLRLSKIFVHEGGIATSLIVNWPAGIPARGELRHQPGHLIDLVPTVLALAGAGPRADPSAPPFHGKSLVPLFAKDGSVPRDGLWWLHSGNRALRVGDWKLVSTKANGSWELYDLSRDRAESHDLATAQPEKVAELAGEWTRRTEAFRALARDAAAKPGP